MMKSVFVCVMAAYCISTAFGIDGFGVNATGGAGGEEEVTVTTPEALKSYAETIDTPYIIKVSGTLDLAPLESKKISIRSNKTIRGIGVNPTIIGQLGFKKPTNNVIIERLNIACPDGYGEGNGLCVKEDVTNVFITKCTVYDCWDGLIDITRRSDWITVSWCKFYFTAMNDNNDRVSLVGSSDSATDDYGKLHITYHHNWFGSFCWQRIPSVRFGKVHIYNNFYDCPDNLYGVWSRIKAECLIENNYFKAVNDPYSIHVEKELPADYGKIAASGNAFENCTGVIDDGNDVVFMPTYNYTPDAVADVPAIVQWGAGADGKDGIPPHWFFSYYGDFDISGLVDIDDLVTFVGYWLDTDNIADADYDASGRVDLAEFALFADNWLEVPADVTPPAAPANLSALAGDGLVSLDWNDNSEPDLDGYNVYRSTTFGTGYMKLNSALWTDSNYNDDTVTNNIIYYYIVKAVDTSANESSSSSQVSAIPVDANTLIIQENETGFCSVDGIVDISGEHVGFTGVGYLDTVNATGNGATWKVHADTAGTYTLIWRYANGSTDRPARVLINTVEQIASVNFAATGAFENWSTVTVDATLIAGDNDIRLEATTSGGLANIDYLRVHGSGITAVSCQ